MIKNIFKERLHAGDDLYGIWNGIPDTYVAEICAGAGFDWILIDAEHGPFDLKSILANMQAINQFEVPSIVRIPKSDPTLIKQLLDLGVQTMMVPMVESADQASLLVKAMRYPPDGMRGIGTAQGRAAQWNREADYLNEADGEMCLILQVESMKGVEALDQILQVDGVDVVFIGPADLAASMGFRGESNRDEVVSLVVECMRKIEAAGKYSGVFTTSRSVIQTYKRAGVNMIGVGLDSLSLAEATKELADSYKVL